jgi:hypothetical protein
MVLNRKALIVFTLKQIVRIISINKRTSQYECKKIYSRVF